MGTWSAFPRGRAQTGTRALVGSGEAVQCLTGPLPGVRTEVGWHMGLPWSGLGICPP